MKRNYRMKQSCRTKLACVIGVMLVAQGMLAPAQTLAETMGVRYGVSGNGQLPSDCRVTGAATPSEAETRTDNLATPSSLLSAPQLYSSSIGDLWEEWTGDMDFSGDGTEDCPYQIGSLAELMGLSELVASGEGFEGEYFELTQDIRLTNLDINYGNWNPIGWYQNAVELSGDVTHSFRGHFDGAVIPFPV